MLVLHVNWSDGSLRLWAESGPAFLEHARHPVTDAGHASGALEAKTSKSAGGSTAIATLAGRVATGSPGSPGAPARHAFAASSDALAALLVDEGLLEAGALGSSPDLKLLLPADEQGPLPSPTLAALAAAADPIDAAELGVDAHLSEVEVPALALVNSRAIASLLRMEDRGPTPNVHLSHTFRYWLAVGRFVLEMLTDQRFIPTLLQHRGQGVRAAWQPWVRDEAVCSRVAALASSMPPVARAVVDQHDHQPASILDEATRVLTDAAVRRTLIEQSFGQAIHDRDPAVDDHVAWLSGLLDGDDRVLHRENRAADLIRDVRQWIDRLDDRSAGRKLRLGLKLTEPPAPPAPPVPPELAEPRQLQADWQDGSERWTLSLHLVGSEDSPLWIDAEQIWTQSARGGGAPAADGKDDPQRILLAELGRASRIWPRIETALAEPAPTAMSLTTAEAHEFLTEYRPLLEESGFTVMVPAWWGDPSGRLGARLRIEVEDDIFADSSLGPPGTPGDSSAVLGAKPLGLASLVRYRWQIAVGDQPLSLEQFAYLSEKRLPLIRLGGRWIQVNKEDLAAAAAFLNDPPGGHMTLLEAIRLAHGVDERPARLGPGGGLPIVGLDATGWVGRLLDSTSDGPLSTRIEMLQQPTGFIGTLRPYQRSGLSWLAFLDRLGLGACLADDMGLGKTIQLIALLLWEREIPQPGVPSSSSEEPNSTVTSVGPTLLIVPTSVVGNWTRELRRFAPSLRYHVQHGLDRPTGKSFHALAAESDVVITTYALVSRDAPTLLGVSWRRVVLDEAQYIKNPPTKQATSIRSLKAQRRVALTGTPVENRLSELWSIMEFCNPGYLGQAIEFRRRFAVPVERHRDRRQAQRLRGLVRPFVLRRLKSDPNVINDLPDCVQTKEFATLSAEQAALYQACVSTMLAQVDKAEGIQRRGLVLATLVKLKQVCDHPALIRVETLPAQFPGATSGPSDASASRTEEGIANGFSDSSVQLAARSGKCRRLLTMLEEVIACGERALIFTQFRRMGHLLAAMVQSAADGLDREALFLHGGTPPARRQEMIDRFQSPDGRAPVFILSLKAGGVGLNLTAANHVFHFDRWWNPAVENQATDRAYRIGQTRTVHVHKFVCLGTLEERIDEMLESKSELAANIIGSGEAWLTELSTGQLRDLLTLRDAAVEVE